jgi:MFS family permease
MQAKINHHLMFGLCWVAGMCAGMASALMPVFLPTVINTVTGMKDTATISNYGAQIAAIFLLGWTAGGALLGRLADKKGRRIALILSVLLAALPTGLIGCIHSSWPILLLLRFLAGAGIGGTLVNTATFIAEIWPEKSRSTALSLQANSYAGGVILASMINQIFTDAQWNLAFLAGSAGVLLLPFLLYTMQDSPLWQQYKSKEKGNTALLQHKESKKNLIIGSLVFGSVLIGLWAAFSWLPTWIQSLIPDPEIARIARGKGMMILGMGGIAGTFLSGWLSNSIGRRKTLMISLAGCFLASLLLFGTNHQFSQTIFIQIGFLSLCIGLSQGLMTHYIPELFPTALRGTAIGLCFNIGRVFTALAVFTSGMIIPIAGGFAQAILAFSAAYLIGLAGIIPAPETKDKQLILLDQE